MVEGLLKGYLCNYHACKPMHTIQCLSMNPLVKLHSQLLFMCLKLRFHLCVMRMSNATKNRKHRISIAVLPFRIRMWMRSTMTTKWIPFWVIGANANVLLDRKSLHTHDRRRVAHTSNRGKLLWSLNIIRHSQSSSYSHYGQVES